jgi:hypothetical protein
MLEGRVYCAARIHICQVDERLEKETRRIERSSAYTYMLLNTHCFPFDSAACALASIFAPTFRIFIAARSIPPFLARSYIFNAVSRLSAGRKWSPHKRDGGRT